MADAHPAAAALNAALAKMIPRAYEMGVRFLEVRAGFVRATVPLEGNQNHLGTVYAGAIFALAEVLGGGIHQGTFDSRAYYPIARALAIEFKAPGRGPLFAQASLGADEIATVKETAAAKGKAPFTLQAEITAEDGTLVATSRADYQIRRHGT
jgi:acyl-coenzyme A thioesterase PaaI-like protein